MLYDLFLFIKKGCLLGASVSLKVVFVDSACEGLLKRIPCTHPHSNATIYLMQYCQFLFGPMRDEITCFSVHHPI